MGFFPFVGTSFDGRSPSFDGQRAVNFYLEPSESKSSRSPAMLIGTPGLRLWRAIAASGNVRALIAFSETQAIAIVGSTAWSLTTAGVATQLSGDAINLLNGPVVSMASNGSLIMCVTGPSGYFINPSAMTVTHITDPDFYGGDRVDYLDGYFIWNWPGTERFQITQLYGTTIDGLDFASAEGSPDLLRTLIVDHREGWMLGIDSTEVFVNTGNPDFPIERIQGAFLEIGCAAAQSVAKMDNTIFWLATDDRGYGTVQCATGYTPQRVSNHAVEHAINGYTNIADAVGYTYQQEGHSFYVLSFPTAGATWVLDRSTGLWHERAWRDPATGLLGRHRSNCQMNFGGMTIVGDWENSNLYVLDLDTFTDNGDPIESIRIAPHIADDDKRVFFQSLQIDMQTGVGLTTGQGSDPQAMLKWSDDGGYTWSNERWATFGRIGERYTRVIWRRLGQGRDRVFYLSITDSVRRIVTGASLRAKSGTS